MDIDFFCLLHSSFISIKERGNYFGGRACDLILGNLQQLIHHFHIAMEEDDEEKRKKLREKRGPCSSFYCDTFSINAKAGLNPWF